MDKIDPINLSLRTEIIKIALNLELGVDLLLIALLSITKSKRKALSNKSGTLTFKNKIDLLFDLDIIESNDHKNLVLLMEFRNQFLHNIDCCYFCDAFTLLGSDRKENLLKFNTGSSFFSDDESRSLNAYKNLYYDCLKLLSAKTKERSEQIQDRRDEHQKYLQSYIWFADRFFDISLKVLTICERYPSLNPEVIALVNEITATIEGDIYDMVASEDFIQIKSELDKMYGDRIRRFFN